MFWIYCIVIAVISYFAGSFNGAIIASKYIFRKDVREYGSGNAGLTNFHRVFGLRGLVLVLLIDIAKTAICVWLGGVLFRLSGSEVILGKIFAGFCVMVGHMYPVMYGFKGGKGVLACGVMAWIVDWRVGAIAWGIFIIVVLLTRYVSLSSMLGSASFPFAVAAFGGSIKAVLLGAVCAAFLVAKHNANIVRLIKREESKLSFSKKKSE